MFGEPDSVYTMGTKGFVTGVDGYETEDLTVTAVRFKSGTLASISTGCYATGGEAFDSKITFSARDSRLDHRILNKVSIYGGKTEETVDESGLAIKGDGTLSRSDDVNVRTIAEEGDAGYLCDRTFVDDVISGDASAIRSPYADAVRTLAFTLACNKSMDTGLPVKVEA
jgi:predicted dehydrogenase